MQLNILIIGALCPAIPLMMINFGNRYSLLAKLIRNLHDTVISEKNLNRWQRSLFSPNRKPSPKTAADRYHPDLQFTCIYL